MSILLKIKSNVIHIDYFGICLNLTKEVENYYIAVDGDGSIYVYEHEPVLCALGWLSETGKCLYVTELYKADNQVIDNQDMDELQKTIVPILTKVSDHPVLS